MSKGVQHIWFRLNGDKVDTCCGKSVARSGSHEDDRKWPTRYNLEGATCLHCLKQLRDTSLRKARDAADMAVRASTLYTRITLRRARKKGTR